MQPKGLICAGGEATRLGELTRVANKHLLPVGSWPMIYYPLQLLQLAGITDVLLVTGKGHAGQMIDLLGDGRLAPRGGGDPILELISPTRSRRSPAASPRSSAWRRTSPPERRSWSCSGTTSSSSRSPRASDEWAESPSRARIFVKQVDDPENFGVVVYGDDGEVADIVEKAGVVDMRFDEPPTSQAVVGLYRYPADVFDVIGTLNPSARGELEITDVNRHYALVGRLEASEVDGWWEDAGKHWQHLADIGRRIDETGANKRDAA